MKKHFLTLTLFYCFVCTLSHGQTRRLEAKKKGGEGSAGGKVELIFNTGHSSSIQSMCYSPDGAYIASASRDKTIKIWEVETGRLLRTLTEHTDAVNSVAYSPDGAYLASGSWDCTVKIWEVETGNCIKTLTEHTSAVNSVAYSSDGRYLASGGSWDKTIKLWDVASEICIKTFVGHTDSVHSVAYSPDGRYLASGSDDSTIKIWDVASGECLKTLYGHMSDVNSICYSPDGTYLASGSQDKTIKIWNVASGKCTKTVEGASYSVKSVSFSPDGAYLASGGFSDGAKLWELSTGECTKIGEGEFVAYSPDGRHLASSNNKGGIDIWEIESAKMVKTFGGHTNSVYSVSFAPDGKSLATGSSDHLIKIWDASNAKQIKTFKGQSYSVSSVAYSPNGKYLASGSLDGTVKIWDVASAECIKTLTGHKDNINSVAYSPNGKYLASASGTSYKHADTTIKIWDVATGECTKTLEGHTDQVNTVSFSPDGKYLASGSDDKTVKIWDARSGKCVKTLTGDNYSIKSVAYSPDGAYLASGYGFGIRIWETKTGNCIKTLEGHRGTIFSIVYSPNGKYLATGSWDNTVKIWNVATGECIKTLVGHTGGVKSVCYSPDGAYLVSGSDDHTIRFWNAHTGELLATTFNLKDDEWLTYTPEGFFAGSEWAVKNLVHIVDGMKTTGIDQMFDSLYRPDLVSAKLSGEDISAYAKKINFASLMQTGSAPIARFLESGGEAKNRDVTVEFTIEDTGGGIGEVNLLLNRKNIRLAEKVASKSGQTVHFSHIVTLQNGENTLELYAKNAAGKIESLRVSKTLKWHGNVKKPNLYILTVAVNQYRDADLRLRYAVPDAKFIAEGFSNQNKSLYQNIFNVNLFDGDVTKDGIKSSFEKLATEVEADDVFVFYIAGHGVTYDEDGDYYYLPSDFRYKNSKDIQKQGISKKDLVQYLTLIKAGKTLVLMDTCNSGSFLGGSTRGLSEKSAVDRLTRSTGHATIVAALKSQVAMEGYEGHGIFTYIFVEGLKGKADANKDGFITLQELSSYVEEEVPRRSFDKWGYEQTPMRDLRKQDFPICAGFK